MRARRELQQTLLFILIILFSVNTSLAARRSWYVGGYLGTHFDSNGDTHIPAIGSSPPLKSEPVYQNGFVSQLNLGVRDENVRLEGEFSFQNLPMNRINDAIGRGRTIAVSQSYTNLFSFFFNGYYDFNFYTCWKIYPYVGLGTGYVKVRNMIRPSSPIIDVSGLLLTKKEVNYDTWGYQGILGIIYTFTENIHLDFNYKYFATIRNETRGLTNVRLDRYHTKQKITDHMILFGIKYYFI
jgi:opacity protein-like surface antigen